VRVAHGRAAQFDDFVAEATEGFIKAIRGFMLGANNGLNASPRCQRSYRDE
jgi:hypothetical protein